MQNYSTDVSMHAINSMIVHYLIKHIFHFRRTISKKKKTYNWVQFYLCAIVCPFFHENKIATKKKGEEVSNKFVNYAKLLYLCYANNKHFQLSINVIPLNLICRHLNSIARSLLATLLNSAILIVLNYYKFYRFFFSLLNKPIKLSNSLMLLHCRLCINELINATSFNQWYYSLVIWNSSSSDYVKKNDIKKKYKRDFSWKLIEINS